MGTNHWHEEGTKVAKADYSHVLDTGSGWDLASGPIAKAGSHRCRRACDDADCRDLGKDCDAGLACSHALVMSLCQRSAHVSGWRTCRARPICTTAGAIQQRVGRVSPGAASVGRELISG